MHGNVQGARWAFFVFPIDASSAMLVPSYEVINNHALQHVLGKVSRHSKCS